MSGDLPRTVLGIVLSIIIIVVGVIILSALYTLNPFIAVVGIILLIVIAISIVIGFIRSQTD
jgi:predicted tellurium resistance membrane protein TerC